MREINSLHSLFCVGIGPLDLPLSTLLEHLKIVPGKNIEEKKNEFLQTPKCQMFARNLEKKTLHYMDATEVLKITIFSQQRN